MNNLPAEQLQSFDAVTIRPRAAAPAGSLTLDAATPTAVARAAALLSGSSSGGGGSGGSGGGGGGDGEEKSENVLAAKAGGLGEHRVAKKRTGLGAPLEEAASPAATKDGDDDDDDDGGVNTEEAGLTITVRRDLCFGSHAVPVEGRLKR